MLGLGRSGIAAAKALCRAGHQVVAVDENAAPVDKLAEMNRHGIEAKAMWKGRLSLLGVSAVVTSPGFSKNHHLLQEAIADGLEVMSEVELAYRLTDDPIVAITGTNGKSTTTVMTWLCAKAAGFDAVLCGNIYGSGYEDITLTEAASPLAFFAEGEKGEGVGGEGSGLGRALIAEISSFQLEWVKRFRPKAAVITNITADHLNRYEGFDDYAETKQRIFSAMGPGDCAAWHFGDRLTEPPAGIRTLSYGEAGNDAWVDDRRMHVLGEFIRLDELPFSEPHNYLNAMAACLLAFGLSDRRADPIDLIHALKGFHGLAHRMERLPSRGGVELINNSMCTNPAAVIASSKAIAKPQRLLIGGSNKGLDFRPVGAYLQGSGHHAYLFGVDGKSIAEQLGGPYPVFNTMAEAFAAAVSDAKPGEVVMLAPGVASQDQFVDFRDRGEAFRQLAKEWLNENMDQ